MYRALAVRNPDADFPRLFVAVFYIREIADRIIGFQRIRNLLADFCDIFRYSGKAAAARFAHELARADLISSKRYEHGRFVGESQRYQSATRLLHVLDGYRSQSSESVGNEQQNLLRIVGFLELPQRPVNSEPCSRLLLRTAR